MSGFRPKAPSMRSSTAMAWSSAAAGRATARGTPLSAGAEPNDLWCADFKGEFMLGNGRYCYPLTVTDHASDSWFGQIGWRAAVRPVSRTNWRYPASAGLRRRSSQAQRSAGWSPLDWERRHVGACARVKSDAPLLRWQKHTG